MLVRTPVRAAYLVALVSLVAACGEDTTPAPVADPDNGAPIDDGTDPGTDPGDDPAGNPSEEPSFADCDRVGFDTNQVSVQSSDGNVRFRAVDATTQPFDMLNISSLRDWNGPTTPGTYSLEGINYLDCGLCLLAYADCEGSTCAKTFYADAGEVEIDAIGFEVGDEFSGRFHDVVFREVTISSDYVSTPVDGGETWCMSDVSFHGFAAEPAPAGACDSALYDCVGEEVSTLSVQSCDTGEMVDVRSIADGGDGAWVVLTAGWCTACHQFLPQVFDALDTSLDMFDLDLVVILGEDRSGNDPTLAYCQGYADQYDHGRANFYLDPGHRAVFSKLWVYPTSDGAFGLPWNALISSENGEFVYADGADPELDINAGLNLLLGASEQPTTQE